MQESPQLNSSKAGEHADSEMASCQVLFLFLHIQSLNSLFLIGVCTKQIYFFMLRVDVMVLT